MDRRARRAKAGFTLVEIMIVLAILVLLIAMVGPRLLKQQDKADKQITQQQIKSVEQALDLYKIANRTYPSTEEGIAALISKPADEARSRNWDGPYLDADTPPIDPWGNQLRYEYPPSNGSDKPQIWSLGEDGKENTEDDIKNWTGDSNATGDQQNGNVNANAPAPTTTN